MPILDHTGQPMKRAEIRALAREEAGPTVTGVRPVLSMHPSEGLTPQRLARLLKEAEAGNTTAYLELAEDLEEKFFQFRAVLGTRKLAVAQLDITVEAAGDGPAEQKAADLVRDALAKLDMAQAVFDLLDGVSKGFAVTEVIWNTSVTPVLPVDLLWRDPRWFQFDPVDGRTLRIRDEGEPNGRDLPLRKFLVHQPLSKSGLPIRAGIARPAAWLYMFQAFGWKDWLAFIEVYGHPARIGKYGPAASKEDRETLLRAVRNIATDFAAIIPNDMLVEFLKADAQGNADVYDRLLSRVEQLASKLVLGQVATTDAIAGGHAVSQEHRQVQGDIRDSDAASLSRTLSLQLAKPIVEINLGPQARYPQITIGEAEAWDVRTMMPEVERFVRLGGKVGMSTIRDKLGLPDPGKDEELLGTGAAVDQGADQGDPAATGADKAPAKPPPGRRALASAAPPEADQDLIDAAIDAVLADHVPLMEPAVQQILQAAEGAASTEDFLARLAALEGGLDLEAVRTQLARLAFGARAAARAGADLTGGGDAS